MQKFTELKVWEQAHKAVLEVYRLSSGFPSDERYGITAQLRRAAVSIPTNIAEGSKRKSNAEYARFLNVAEGSLAETQYFIILSRDLGYLTEENAESLTPQLAEVARMLHALRCRVEEMSE